MTVETVVIGETFVTGETVVIGVTVETLVTGEIIMISGVVYYNRVMDNILSLMASLRSYHSYRFWRQPYT